MLCRFIYIYIYISLIKVSVYNLLKIIYPISTRLTQITALYLYPRNFLQDTELTKKTPRQYGFMELHKVKYILFDKMNRLVTY